MFLLKDIEPLAKGRSRLVFQHPEEDNLLIKVIRPDVIEDRFGTGTKWYKRPRRHGQFISYAREISEYLVTRAASKEAPSFLQKVVGFAETDFGLGLVIEAIRTTSGELAPPLSQIIVDGLFNQRMKDDLARTLENILESNIVVSDLNLGNFVHNGNEFILIDGIGNNNLFRFKIMSSRINRRSKLKRFNRLYARIERCKRQHNIHE